MQFNFQKINVLVFSIMLIVLSGCQQNVTDPEKIVECQATLVQCMSNCDQTLATAITDYDACIANCEAANAAALEKCLQLDDLDDYIKCVDAANAEYFRCVNACRATLQAAVDAATQCRAACMAAFNECVSEAM